jgi:predicted CopG family antitoxin
MAQNEPQEVQMPKFRYQAVLRDSNNVLVKNQSGTVLFSLKETSWGEERAFTTNENGLVSLELDYDEIDADQNYNWNGDTLTAVFTIGSKTITLNTPVTAVPYALQAADVRITTPMLTDYFSRPTTDGYDVDDVYQALLNNPTFSQVCRDSAVNYIKAHYEIAKEIAYAYLDSVTVNDVTTAYDTMHYVDVAVKQAFYDIIKDYLKNHRSLLLEVAEYYITTATLEEAEELYTSFETSTAAPRVRSILLDYFEQYLRGRHLICENNPDWTLCSAAAYVASNMVCPQISSAQGFSYTTNNNVDSLVYQVVVDDMGTIDLSTVTVSVKIKTGAMGDQIVTKNLTRVGTTNRFHLNINGSEYVVPTNQTFKVLLNKPGCQEISVEGQYTPVPNN